MEQRAAASASAGPCAGALATLAALPAQPFQARGSARDGTRARADAAARQTSLEALDGTNVAAELQPVGGRGACKASVVVHVVATDARMPRTPWDVGEGAVASGVAAAVAPRFEGSHSPLGF
jgi:hypothetical protein